MIDNAALNEMTKEKMQELRIKATQTLVNNQECFVAQWILQNPFENIQDYQMKFYNDDPECVYSVRMEKIV